MQNPQAPPAPSPAEYNDVAGLRQQAFGASRPFYKTVLGMLKLGSIFLGFIAILVSMIGYTTSTWLQQMEYGRLCKNCPNYISTKYSNKSYQIYPETMCEFLKDKQLGGVTNDTACPSRWLVVPQVFIFAHTWAATVIVYVIMLKVDLSKNRAFGLFDVIGHSIAAFVTIVCGLCLFAFFAMAQGKEDCPIRGKEADTCRTIYRRIYQQLFFLCGGILTVLTGIIYIVIVVRANDASKKPRFLVSQVHPSQYPLQQSPSTPAPATSEPSQVPEKAK